MPLALTSANVSGQVSTVAVQEFEPLWSQARPWLPLLTMIVFHLAMLPGPRPRPAPRGKRPEASAPVGRSAQCALVFDGGCVCASRDGSTVVDLAEAGTYAILRNGMALQATSLVLERHGLKQRTTVAAASPGGGASER